MKIDSTNESYDNIVVTNNGNIIRIEIKEDCSLMFFYYEITQKLTKEIANQINMSSILNDSRVNKKVLYVINEDNKVYNVSYEIDRNNNIIYDTLFISEKCNQTNNFTETTLKILPNNNYTVTKKGINSITSGFKIYMNNKEEEKKFIEQNKYDMNIKFKDEFILSKKQAFRSINDILGTLKKVDNIETVVQLTKLYEHFGVIPHSEHIPIIKDDSISLSYYDTEDNKELFYIVLNKTKEIVGKINLGYSDDGIINDIDYKVFESFQDKKLDIRALKMLRVLLENDHILNSNSIINQLPTSTEKDNEKIVSVNPMQKIKNKKKH